MAESSKEVNYAGQRLVVDSIQVLQNIESGQIKEITSKVEAMQVMQDSYNTQQKNYWNALGADNKITASEKKILKKEWDSIQDTYTKLETEATNRGIQDSSYFNTYETYYSTLNTLLNTTLKLFDNMSQTTTISDRDDFNEAYSNYYSLENYCQMVLADAKTDNYWEQMTDDLMISPIEKKSLLYQMKQITQRFNGYKNQALAKGMLGQSWWVQFADDYQDLYDYVYTTLALFDDMEETTVISSRTTFNSLFDTYNQEETFVSVTLNENIMGTLGFRTLNNLSESGTEGEVGLYHGTIYQYVVSQGAGMWAPVGAEGYAGVMHQLPATSIENQYFLCDQNFTLVLPLEINILNASSALETREVTVNTDSETGVNLLVNYEFTSGYIYIYQSGVWTKITDRTNYRYLQTMLEYWNITGELPAVFQNLIITTCETEIQSELASLHHPHYLGASDLAEPAVTAYEGDWFLYTGETISNRTNSIVYVYQNSAWVATDPTDASQGEKYMAALVDILKENNATAGYFSAVFCAALYANTVFTNMLNTSQIVLSGNGVIQSSNYSASNNTGFRIEGSTGKAIFNSAEIRGELKGATGTFSGNLNAAGGTFSGNLNAAGGTFNGDISGASGTFSGNLSGCYGYFTRGLKQNCEPMAGGTKDKILKAYNALTSPGMYNASGYMGTLVLDTDYTSFTVQSICRGSNWITINCTYDKLTKNFLGYLTGIQSEEVGLTYANGSYYCSLCQYDSSAGVPSVWTSWSTKYDNYLVLFY